MKQKNILFNLYVATLILSMLQSMNIKYLWEVNTYIIDVFSALLGICYFFCNRLRLNRNIGLCICIYLFVLIAAFSQIEDYGFRSISYLKVSFFVMLLCCTDEFRKRLLGIWTKTYAIILVVSLIATLLVPTGILPYYGIISPSWYEGDGYLFLDYGLCLVSINSYTDIIRFCSVFLEPGHVAMIGAFTVFANKFDFHNKWNLSVFIVSLLTFSLAGYVLLALGYFLKKVSEGDFFNILKKLVPYVILLLVVVVTAQNYKDGNNYLNKKIIERLQYDKDRGIAGNNRFTQDFSGKYDDFLSSKYAGWGYPSNLMPETTSNAGYKVYIMQNGIWGTFMIFLAYFLMVKFSHNKRFMFCMLILYSAAFLQRGYPLWNVWLYLFAISMSTLPPKKNTGAQLLQRENNLYNH